MNIEYFQKVNNIYQSKDKQESDLYLLNRHTNNHFNDTIDYHVVGRIFYDNEQKIQMVDDAYELLIARDSDSNTMQKKIKARPGQGFNLGDYIVWDNQTWIVSLLDPDNKTYVSGQMKLCSTILRWINDEGEIVQRPAYVEDFTKYSGGETSNGVITVGDNQYGCIVPSDYECIKLKREQRFVIDELLEYPDVYRITNRKVALSNYASFGRGGTITLTLTIDGFNADIDKYVQIDEKTMGWICDYGEEKQPEIKPDEEIIYNIDGATKIKLGTKKRYLFTFENSDGQDVSQKISNWTFEIDSDVNVEIINGVDSFTKYIQVPVDRRNLDKVIAVTLKVDNVPVCAKTITIVE